MKDLILVITTILDIASDRIIDILNQRKISVTRINTEEIPYNKSLTFSILEKKNNYKSIWFRRIRGPECPKNCDINVHNYVKNETYSALKGEILLYQDKCRLMSNPINIDASELKPYQLHCAQKVGLLIPPTLITSCSEEIKIFYHQYDTNVIAKTIRSGYFELNNEGYAIYTHLLNNRDIELLDSSLPCPIILQQNIKKKVDIRVTIVGDEIFSAEIHSQSDPEASIDWRNTSKENLHHEIHKLPIVIEEKLVNLTKTLGLSFGAIDLILDDYGNYYFLEINPNGQWLWIEDKLNIPISEAVANWLAGVK